MHIIEDIYGKCDCSVWKREKNQAPHCEEVRHFQTFNCDGVQISRMTFFAMEKKYWKKLEMWQSNWQTKRGRILYNSAVEKCYILGSSVGQHMQGA